MSFSFDDSFSSGDGGAPAGGASLAGIPAGAPPLPRVVTTGRKKHQHKPEICGVDQDTGEPVEITSTGKRRLITRYLIADQAARPTSALIDWMAFSVTPPDEHSYKWVLDEMAQFLDIGTLEMRKGWRGFKFSAGFGEGVGLIAWGGKSQNGKVFFSLTGQGCSRVRDWSALADWLEHHHAKIKRVDVAYDDFEGKLLNIAWAIEQYQKDGFNAGGRKPRHEMFGDVLDGDESVRGRTLAIGSRGAGKYCRIYEKGKQLGDPASRWTRVEVEWCAQDRYIPYDVLVRPGNYLAGAYPCLASLSEEQSVIKTITKGATISLDRAVENTKQHAGKTINLLLEVKGGDYVEVVNLLKRPGFPARVDPYSYHIKRDPSVLDRDLREASE